MAGIFSIGLSGIQAAQAGLMVTQHNISNSSTPGYNRQSTVQASASTVGTASGFYGNGVKVTTVMRQYDNFLSGQVRQAETQFSSLDSYYSKIQVIDNLMADAEAGVSPALQSFFSGVQQVASSPASLAARQVMVTSGESLVARLQSVNARITDLYAQTNQQIGDVVGSINSYASQISVLNERITVAQSGIDQPANDLLDKRDQLIAELNKLVEVQVVPTGNNGVDVSIGRGLPLVAGNQANQLNAVKSSDDPSRISVAITVGSVSQELPESFFSGGSLGGLLDFRAQTLDSTVNNLGNIAASLALTVNAQHAKGMDLLGNNLGDANFAANFFQIGSPKVIPNNQTSPVVSASFTLPRLSTPESTGNYYTDLTGSDYRLEYQSGTFTLKRLSDNAMWTDTSIAGLNAQITNPNAPNGAQGFTLSDNGGAYHDGDSYLIEPTREIIKTLSVNASIAGDVRLIAAGSPLKATVGLANTGSMTAAVQRMTSGTPSLTYPIQVTVSGGNLSFPAAYNGQTVSIITASGSSNLTIGTDPIPFTASASYKLDGAIFSLGGTPKNGDTFTLNWNDGQSGSIGVSDSSNILLLGKLQTQNTIANGNTTYQGAYAQIVSTIGNKTNEVKIIKDAQQSLVEQATANRESVSGVNLDEEAASLLKYQQLYQASARSLSIGQKLFDELLSVAAG